MPENFKVSEALKKRFLVPFQEIFAVDTEFPYNKSDASKSKLVISSKFATPKENNKLPQIILNNTSYNTQTTTLFNGFLQEQNHYTNAPKTLTGRKYKSIVYFTLGIDTMSTIKKESEWLADRIFSILNHEYEWLFQEIGIHINALGVSDSMFKAQYPQYEFTTTVTVQGNCSLEWEEFLTQDKEHILQHIRVLVADSTDL